MKLREYRKRKHALRISELVERASSGSIEGALPASMRRPEAKDKTRQRGDSKFKTALELARPFPSGILASQVCPYCYDTGYSSPDTRCSYCPQGAR